jgi:TetR/AcrR family transcriptional regulator, transcriptional repressor of aconitase
MPRTTPAYDEARRGEILEAAYRCFSEAGLHGTTMQAVAEAAGLSVGALYRYFDGKENLFAALAARAGERRRRVFEKLEKGAESEGLASVVAGMMAELGASGATRSVRLDIRLWAEALDDAELAEALRSALADIREPVAERMRATERAARPTLDPEAVGRVVVSLLVGLELQRAHDEGLDLQAYREVVRAMLSGLERE